MSFLLPLTMLAACSVDETEIEERSFTECPELAGHWIGFAESGDEIEAWIYQKDGNIKVATMFFTKDELSNIAGYNLYPDGSSKSESEGPLNEDLADIKVWCENNQLWLAENRTLKIGDLVFGAEMLGYFTREDENTIMLTSVNDSLPSGDVIATLVP